MVFITKKRFEKEVEKRAKAIRREEHLESQVRQQNKEIKKLRERIRDLDEKIDILAEEIELRERGQIKGYYMKDGGCVTLESLGSNTEVVPHNVAMPCGCHMEEESTRQGSE